MELKECIVGRPVVRKGVPYSNPLPDDIGHIVRFTKNTHYEIVVVVLLASGDEVIFHPNNLESLV
jgi:hypothetical protein